MSLLALRAGQVFTPGGVIEDGVVLVDGRTIRAVGSSLDGPLPAEADVLDVRPHSIAAGFIDIHVHGAAGSDFMDDTDEAFSAITAWHAAGGTTSLLATTCAALLDEIGSVLQRVAQWQQAGPRGGAAVLGAHCEGPFFTLEMRGCHLPEYIRNPEPALVDALLEHAGAIRHTTLAPELPGALAAIGRFRKAGISVAAAHSNASCDDVAAAIEHGLSHVTHLWNAMSSVLRLGPKRVPGLAETALMRDDLTVELIADGLHVHPLRLQLAVRCKGVNRISLVSDALRAAGMPDGLYAFGPRRGKQAVLRDGVSTMPEGTGYASSTIPMARTVQVMVQQAAVSLPDALTMAAANPARVIGVDQRKGALRTGMDADLVVLDEELQVSLTMVEGQIVYQREAPGCGLDGNVHV